MHGRSQWDLVWDQFRRDRVAMVGLCLVVVLFFVATAAPVITNGHPLLLCEDGQWSSPALRNLFAPPTGQELVLDRIYDFVLCWSLSAALLLLPVAGGLRLARCSPRLRRQVPRLGAGVLACVWLVPFLSYVAPLDKTDYRAKAARLTEEGRGWARFAMLPYGPIEQLPEVGPLRPPSRAHWMGTDGVSRDVFARVVYGARVSLSVGFVGVAIYILIGTILGAISAYYGGWVDVLLSRFIEIVMCFPTFLLILTIVAFLEKRSIFNIMVVIGLTGWTGVARLVRGEVLRQKQMDYVSAARALGMGNGRIIFRHVLPNSLAPVLVSATFGVAGAILTETGLSFLGLGVQMPTPSWGQLLNEARDGVGTYWWLTVWPGVLIFFSVTIYNLVGEGLRDALDPRLRR
ncbi:MAG: ABC transporter permease [Lentisphaeria bacterium]|nr:ABC transporter permease [Lentisphaeria bacterium]